MKMDGETEQLHVVLFPFMAHGHMIPTLDMARLFAARGVKTTLITTPLNAPTFTTAIQKGKNTSRPPLINIQVFRFPAQEAGLPQGCENLEQALGPGVMDQFFKASAMLKEQLEQFLDKTRPDCLMAGMIFTWATDSASKFNIPRLVFHGTCYFSLCLSEELWSNKETDYKKRSSKVKESELESFGVIVNSFYELEPDYADFFKKDLGRRAWHIGPVSLYNRSNQEKAQRGKTSSIDQHECLKWLNSKKPDSVIYICFGSTIHLIPSQIHQVLMALEATGQEFIWVVRNEDDLGGFEQKMTGKGLIIRGWAPQMLILEHEAIGAFVTHCGWNSTLEGIAAGLPMVTWPMFAEQFYNEKLVTDILKIGIPVGAKKWTTVPSIEDVIKQNAIEKALREIMEGDAAEERRCRSKEFKNMAWKALEEGGSSYSDLSALIHELRGLSTKNHN
ncbi:hypothetical protein SOVF_051200 [Spinacia oleracea]|nr:hypothetical protein SOVF_051200 [Spinacia oleracea]